MADESYGIGHDSSFAVRWQDFRAFRDTGWVTLKPLTLLLGPNSAGKTSFLAPLLLLKQSLESRTGTNALLTKGDLLDVGVYEDFVRDHDRTARVTFGVRWHYHPKHKDLAPPGGYAPGSLEVAFGEGTGAQSVSLESYRVYDTYGRVMLSRTRREDGTYTTQMVPAKNMPGGRTPVAEPNTDERRAMRRTIREAQSTDFLFLSKEVRQAGLKVRMESDEPTFSTTIDDERSRLYCSITDHTLWGIESILDKLHFIGPLRDEPKRVYELSGETPDEVGIRGEFAPEIVYRWRNRKRRMDDVQRWLRHFGFEEELSVKSVGTGGFSLGLTRDGAAAASTFVDTGFGMSQVLPLVVQALVAEPDEWLVIEQPEVHLNPRLQAALADMFASVVKRGVNLIVESHSEHLLLRLRRLIAQDKLNGDSVGLYFVEQEAGVSGIRNVPITSTGHIDAKEWPREFFEDSLREAMELAQAQAARRKRLKRLEKQRERQLQLIARADEQGSK